MAHDGYIRFLVEIIGPSGEPLNDQESSSLRDALVDHGAASAQEAPPARFADPATIIAVAAAGVQAVATVTEILKYLQAWRERHARNGHLMRIRVGGHELANEPVIPSAPLVQVLVRRSATGSGRRFAMIVACDQYLDPGLQALRSPANDAEMLYSVLADPEIGDYDVQILRDADERTVRRRVATFFAERAPEDLVLLHFSCHGIKDRQSRLHLAAYDTELKTLGATAIPASFLDSQMAQTSARRVVLVLDCCFSGAYARDMSAKADRSIDINGEFEHSGRVVLTASSATEYAFEGTVLADSAAQPSVFTAALVEGLRTGAADLDGDGEISVDDWYAYAFRSVTERGIGQAPTKSSTSVSGDFVVAWSVRGAPLPATVREDINSERVHIRLAAVEQLERLLTQPAPGLRRSAMAELSRIHQDDDSARVRAAAAQALQNHGVLPTAGPTPGHVPSPMPASAQPASTPPAPGIVSPATVMPPSTPDHGGRAPQTRTPIKPVKPTRQPHSAAGTQETINQLAIASSTVSGVGLLLPLSLLGGFGDALFTAVGGVFMCSVGAVLGHIASRQCRRSRQAGRRLAQLGIVIGWTGTLLSTVWIAGFIASAVGAGDFAAQP